MTTLAERLLRSFALALGLEETYFEQFVDHHASALRALNYPSLEGEVPEPGQIRASAHTDYGTLTILRADAQGLQVSKDKEDPDWFPVPFVPKVRVFLCVCLCVCFCMREHTINYC